MFTILIYITETASLLYLLDSKILCLLVFWHLLCLKKNKMYSVHGSHSFISFLSCSCTNVLSALAYTHPQLDIKVVNTHFLITQLQATVGPKGPSSRPTSHPHYTPNHLHLITQRCDIYLPCILEFLQVLALNLTSFSWTLVLFWHHCIIPDSTMCSKLPTAAGKHFLFYVLNSGIKFFISKIFNDSLHHYFNIRPHLYKQRLTSPLGRISKQLLISTLLVNQLLLYNKMTTYDVIDIKIANDKINQMWFFSIFVNSESCIMALNIKRLI